MNGRKRIRAALLALALLLALASPVLADGEPTIRVTGGEAAPGETVTVTVSIENNPGIASMRLELAYDASHLTLTDGEISPAFADAAMANVVVNTQSNPAVANWFVFTGEVSADGVFCTLTFTVRDDAPGGETPITVSFDPDDLFDANLENVPFSAINGSVTVTGGAAQTQEPSGETEQPGQTEPSGEAGQPGETEKPAEAEQPGQTEQPVLTTGEEPGQTAQTNGSGEVTEETDLDAQIGSKEESLRRDDEKKTSSLPWLIAAAAAVIVAGILITLRMSKKGKKLIAAEDTPDEQTDGNEDETDKE